MEQHDKEVRQQILKEVLEMMPRGVECTDMLKIPKDYKGFYSAGFHRCLTEIRELLRDFIDG